MKFLTHLLEQPFIAATGFAALVHSTWAMGTYFAGVEPERWTIEWVGWLLPALLIAFSLDVGQISTSMKIRENGLNFGNGLAFVVIALFTYYFQFLHLAHHIPQMAIGAGVALEHQGNVQFMIGLSIWVIPALLPLSTLLYTFSPDKSKEHPIEQEHPEPIITIESPILPLLEEKSSDLAPSDIEPIPTPIFAAYCPDCGWSKDYDDSKKADRALNTHKSIHCKAKHVIEEVNQNEHVG